jgi:hypothetical protein
VVNSDAAGPKPFDGLRWVDRLGRIDTDQPYVNRPSSSNDLDGVAVDHSGHQSRRAVATAPLSALGCRHPLFRFPFTFLRRSRRIIGRFRFEPDEGTIVEQHPNSFAEPDWAWAAEKGEERK